MKNYFANCKTLDEAKALYKKLAFQLHPDTGGNTADFQEMQSQFEKFTPQSEKFKDEFKNHRSEDFMKIIEDLIKLRGVIVEVCGSFIWLSGETKENKEAIKAIRNEAFKPAQWHTKKCLWFFAPIDYRRFSGKTFDMDEIRSRYGSSKYEREKEKALAA